MTNFYKDVENHKMTVVADSGVNRHILFKQENTSNYHFSLTTWSGYLCISGDMGTYVFSRLPDMFQFFRTENGCVNLSYWGEKCVADSTSGGRITQWSEDKFISAIKELTQQLISEVEMPKEVRDDLEYEVNNEVLSRSSDGQHEAHKAAQEFIFRGLYRPFSELYEHDLDEFTPRYIWCCHAIAWGIKQYYESKKNDVIMSVEGKSYTCKNMEDASRKYQWLRDLSMKGEFFPPATLSDNIYIINNKGQLIYEGEVVEEAAHI